MRKWLWLGIPTIVILGVGGYWYLSKTSTVTIPDREVENRNDAERVAQNQKHDGDAEASDVIEPLVVDRGGQTSEPSLPPVVDEGPMPRVVLTPGTKQPPRPDAEPDRVLRMPYADEEEILGVPFDPIQRILESKLSKLNPFEDLKDADPSEEAEPMEVVPPPVIVPYHHSHCPYTGGCPAPYPYRALPR